MLSARAPALNGASVCKGDREEVGARGGRGLGGSPRSEGPRAERLWTGSRPAALQHRGREEKTQEVAFFFFFSRSRVKKKRSQKSIMEAKLPWNLTLLPLHFLGFGNPNGFAVVRRPPFCFVFSFFLSFSFKGCFTTLHLHFTYNFSHNHHNSSHKHARGGITFLQHWKLGLRGIK